MDDRERARTLADLGDCDYAEFMRRAYQTLDRSDAQLDLLRKMAGVDANLTDAWPGDKALRRPRREGIE